MWVAAALWRSSPAPGAVGSCWTTTRDHVVPQQGRDVASATGADTPAGETQKAWIRVTDRTKEDATWQRPSKKRRRAATSRRLARCRAPARRAPRSPAATKG